MRLARGIAQGEVAENKAGHAAMLNNVFGGAHNHSGNAVSFEMTCGQTDRLVTDGSVCHQYSQIDFVFTK